ncbi:tyrosine recombinase xerc [Plakobranchus ocellatus]|uniref:Tyrosine recombinase xerc n=1 Tax=Plakobranchus ocellatus TaxID=259542 RepID=A0AAV3YFL9_9GAST|nr:tyrosine recombinase xerc [Plakobranchus ocellatus]
MDIKHMQISEGKAIFHIAPLLKTNSPKNPISTITLRAYREDRRICVFTCLKLYLKRTKHLRSTTQLFISNYSPQSAVTKDTFARWIKSMLNKAGIDTNVYKAHSTRAAASSAAARSIDIAQVLKTAGWSREQTFAKFYNKRYKPKVLAFSLLIAFSTQNQSLFEISGEPFMNIKQDDSI